MERRLGVFYCFVRYVIPNLLKDIGEHARTAFESRGHTHASDHDLSCALEAHVKTVSGKIW